MSETVNSQAEVPNTSSRFINSHFEEDRAGIDTTTNTNQDDYDLREIKAGRFDACARCLISAWLWRILCNVCMAETKKDVKESISMCFKGTLTKMRP